MIHVSKKLLFGLLCITIVLPARAAPTSGTTWTQTFKDDFSGTSLDTTIWNRMYRYGGAAAHTLSGNGELEWYVNDAFVVNNSILQIRAEKRQTIDGGITYPYSSGVITSLGRFSQKYGYFEMRAKMPLGKGFWPAFWLLSDSLIWPPEIDIFEILCNAPNVDYMTCHWNQFGVHKGSGTSWTGPDFSADYHLFGLLWTRGTLVWYVDGVEQRRLASSWLPNAGPMYIIANLAVGGTWPGAPDSATVFPSSMNIDYIKAWQYADTTFAGTNQWPVVSFDSPRNGAYVSAAPSLALTVLAHDPDGSIVRTVFLDSTDSIAGVSAAPFTTTLTGVKPGVHTFYAQVFDTAGAFTVAATTVTVVAGDGNIIKNPQFDDSLNGWSANFSNGAAGVVTTSNPGLSGAHAARFTLSNGGSANWYALLSQTIGMSAHQTLTISFKAKASKAKQMQVVLQRMASPWDYYWSQTVALTAQTQTFGPFVFTPTETANAMFKFFVGGDTTTVWLDSVVAAVDLQSGVSPRSLESESARSGQGPDQFTALVDHGVLRVFFVRPETRHVEIYTLSGRRTATVISGNSLVAFDLAGTPGVYTVLARSVAAHHAVQCTVVIP